MRYEGEGNLTDTCNDDENRETMYKYFFVCTCDSKMQNFCDSTCNCHLLLLSRSHNYLPSSNLASTEHFLGFDDPSPCFFIIGMEW